MQAKFIEGIKNPYVKNKLRSFQIKNLKDILGYAIQEDQNQKTRALDFGKSSKSKAILNYDVNATKGNNCFKYGSDTHFIKDCPLNKDDSNTQQRKHYNTQSKTNFNSGNDHAIEPLIKLFNNLLEQLKQLIPASNTSSNTYTHYKRHYKYKPKQTSYSSNYRQHSRDQKQHSSSDHIQHNNDHRQRNQYYHNKDHKHHKSHYNKHNKRTHSKVNGIELCSECSPECSDISDYEDNLNDQDPPYTRFTKKLDFPSQNLNTMPEDLEGNDFWEKDIRQASSPLHNAIRMDVETKIIHIGRKSHNECAVITTIGNRSQKALWDSGSGRCVISFDCYNSLHQKYKTELFPSTIRIKAANGTFIMNKGECDITLRIDDEQFTFPFLCSDQLLQQMIIGHNFSKAYYIDMH